MTQTAIKDSLSEVDIFNGTDISPNHVKMYIFGKNTFRLAKMLQKIQEESSSIGCFKVAAPKHEDCNPNIYYDTLNGRSKNSVFLNDNIKLNESDKYPIIALKNVKSHYNNYKILNRYNQTKYC